MWQYRVGQTRLVYRWLLLACFGHWEKQRCEGRLGVSGSVNEDPRGGDEEAVKLRPTLSL